ncbi:MAG: tyrosine-type recombinase/integrase [Acidimicrobiales bacterium]
MPNGRGELSPTLSVGTSVLVSTGRRRAWVAACETAGLTGLRFHDLRSLAATALVAVGTDVKTAQTRLGHSSSRMTLDIYARVTRYADQAAAEKVGALLRPSGTQRVRGGQEDDIKE